MGNLTYNLKYFPVLFRSVKLSLDLPPTEDFKVTKLLQARSVAQFSRNLAY